MSNYPDNLNPKALDNYIGSVDDTDWASIRNAQAAYKECVEACVEIFKARGFSGMPKDEISHLGFANGIADALRGELTAEFANLEEEDPSVRPDDHEMFFNRMYAKLKGKV